MAKRKLRCVRCGIAEFDWPKPFSQAFLDEHACPSGRGHFFTSDPYVAAMVVSHG